MKRRLFTVAFAVWIFLWAWFLVRGLFLKGEGSSYRILFSRSLEGKRSYITGDKLYELIKFAEVSIPAGATYKIIGIDDGSIEDKRAVYYLYPRMKDEKADYIVIYGEPQYKNASYKICAKLDGSRFILKRKKGM
jgi:hypothetical protein